MRKNYEMPEMEVTIFRTEDVIVTSNYGGLEEGSSDINEGSGNFGDMFGGL